MANFNCNIIVLKLILPSCFRIMLNISNLTEIIKKKPSFPPALFPSELEQKHRATTCLLDLDLFHYLVTLTMTLPSLHASEPHLSSLPTGGLNDQHALQLVFTAHVVHILLCLAAPCQGELCILKLSTVTNYFL